jgi:hypothetical protein
VCRFGYNGTWPFLFNVMESNNSIHSHVKAFEDALCSLCSVIICEFEYNWRVHLVRYLRHSAKWFVVCLHFCFCVWSSYGKMLINGTIIFHDLASWLYYWSSWRDHTDTIQGCNPRISRNKLGWMNNFCEAFFVVSNDQKDVKQKW